MPERITLNANEIKAVGDAIDFIEQNVDSAGEYEDFQIMMNQLSNIQRKYRKPKRTRKSHVPAALASIKKRYGI